MTTTDTTTTSLRDHYDVVIVGARAAGAATAMLLARAGLRVAAIDKGTYGSDTLSTHAIARTGVLLLNQWGVLDAIRAADTPRANTMLFHYGDNDVAIDIRPRGEVDGLYSPRRTVLDRSLVDAAVDAGAAIRHGTAVQGVVKDRTGRVVGVDIDDGGVHRMIGARFVTGVFRRRFLWRLIYSRWNSAQVRRPFLQITGDLINSCSGKNKRISFQRMPVCFGFVAATVFNHCNEVTSLSCTCRSKKQTYRCDKSCNQDKSLLFFQKV